MGLSIQDLGAIGEFLGAFGVMAPLIYVGLQIKQSRNIVMAESEANYARSGKELYYFVAENPHIAEMVAKDSGREANELTLTCYWIANFFHFEVTYLKHKFGLLGPHAIRHLKGHVSTIRSSQTALTIWQERKDRFDEGFGKFIDASIEEAS